MPDFLTLALSFPDIGSSLLTVFGIGLVIFVHEAGHFMCARLCRVDVEVFSLGFGPRLFGWVRNGTDFRISAVPIGGYVKMLGDQPGDSISDPGSLGSKTVSQRFLVYSGGVIMNAIFALVTFPIIFSAGVELERPAIGGVTPGGAAWKAGLAEGDEVLEINGREMLTFADIALEVALSDPDDTQMLISRGGEEFTVQVHPEYSDFLGHNAIGITQPFNYRLAVKPGGAADRAGLRDGDRLLKIGERPASAEAILDLAEESRTVVDGGDGAVHLIVERDGENQAVNLQPDWLESDDRFLIGIQAPSNWVAGVRGSIAAASLIAEGDLVVSVGGTPVYTDDGFRAAVRDAHTAGRSELSLQLLRGGEPLAVEVAGDLLPALADDVALATNPDRPEGPVPIVVGKGSAAAAAGMTTGMLVTAVDGQTVRNWTDIQEGVERAKDAPLTIAARVADGHEVELRVTPRAHRTAKYGFDIDADMVTRRYGLADACRVGVISSWNFARRVYLTLRKMVARQLSVTNLGGPIAITDVSYHFAKSGLARFFYFLALLSINLAVVNVLPIPVLDGGHLLFLLIEKVKGSPVDDNVMGYSQVLGLVLILSLLIFVTYNDIVRLVQ